MSTLPQDNRTPLRSKPAGNQGLFILLFCGLLLIAFRMHAFSAPLETDECNYITIASRLLDGDCLYIDVWDHQPPGVFILCMGAISVFGDSPEVFRWLATGFSLISLCLLFSISRILFGQRAGIVAALLWAILSSDPGTSGWGCNREIYMNTFVLAALWHLVHARKQGRRALQHILFAGFWLGIASVFKTIIAAYWIALLPAVWLFRPRLNRKTISYAKQTLLFGFGPMVIWMLLFVLIGKGLLPAFMDAVFLYNIGYSGMESGFFGRLLAFFTRTDVFVPVIPLIAGAAVSTILAVRTPRLQRRRVLLLIAFLIGSYVAICLPGRFWSHYYYLMLPPLILLASAGMKIRRIRNWFGYGIIGCVVGFQLWFYLTIPWNRPGISHHHTRMHWARDQGKKLAEATQPDDTVFAWDFAGAGLYYYSGRDCASRYTMIGSLLSADPNEPTEAVAMRREILLEELREKRPRVILIAEQPFQEFLDFLRDEKYIQCGVEHLGDGKVNMIVLTPNENPIEQTDWNWNTP